MVHRYILASFRHYYINSSDYQLGRASWWINSTYGTIFMKGTSHLRAQELLDDVLTFSLIPYPMFHLQGMLLTTDSSTPLMCRLA